MHQALLRPLGRAWPLVPAPVGKFRLSALATGRREDPTDRENLGGEIAYSTRMRGHAASMIPRFRDIPVRVLYQRGEHGDRANPGRRGCTVLGYYARFGVKRERPDFIGNTQARLLSIHRFRFQIDSRR
jgi:hypothetical protein